MLVLHVMTSSPQCCCVCALQQLPCVMQASKKPVAGGSVSEIQPASEIQPVSEIQPASTGVSQVSEAAPYRNSAISQAAAEVKGRPSVTVPEPRPTGSTAAGRVVDRISPRQQSTGQAAANERVQSVPGWTPSNDVTTDEASDPNLRSGSGVPSEAEVAQLYSNARNSADVSLAVVRTMLYVLVFALYTSLMYITCAHATCCQLPNIFLNQLACFYTGRVSTFLFTSTVYDAGKQA